MCWMYSDVCGFFCSQIYKSVQFVIIIIKLLFKKFIVCQYVKVTFVVVSPDFFAELILENKAFTCKLAFMLAQFCKNFS